MRARDAGVGKQARAAVDEATQALGGTGAGLVDIRCTRLEPALGGEHALIGNGSSVEKVW